MVPEPQHKAVANQDNNSKIQELHNSKIQEQQCKKRLLKEPREEDVSREVPRNKTPEPQLLNKIQELPEELQPLNKTQELLEEVLNSRTQELLEAVLHSKIQKLKLLLNKIQELPEEVLNSRTQELLEAVLQSKIQEHKEDKPTHVELQLQNQSQLKHQLQPQLQ